MTHKCSVNIGGFQRVTACAARVVVTSLTVKHLAVGGCEAGAPPSVVAVEAQCQVATGGHRDEVWSEPLTLSTAHPQQHLIVVVEEL